MTKKLVINDKWFNADYAGIGYLGMLKAQIHDERPLSEIAPDVEGSRKIQLIDGDDSRDFDGFTKLMRIERIDDIAVVILLASPDAAANEY